MDFFETREKYRRREVHIYMRWLSRIFFLGLALWLGWQWGSLEQRQLQADADLALYEREQQIEELSGKVQGLNTICANCRRHVKPMRLRIRPQTVN